MLPRMRGGGAPARRSPSTNYRSLRRSRGLHPLGGGSRGSVIFPSSLTSASHGLTGLVRSGNSTRRVSTGALWGSEGTSTNAIFLIMIALPLKNGAFAVLCSILVYHKKEKNASKKPPSLASD